jgi:uncharacterized C2H2 Zn-finger protein
MMVLVGGGLYFFAFAADIAVLILFITGAQKNISCRQLYSKSPRGILERGGEQSESESVWRCAKCGMMNEKTRAYCAGCENARGGTPSFSERVWRCTKCGMMNEKTRTDCAGCKNARETWTCTNCSRTLDILTDVCPCASDP